MAFAALAKPLGAPWPMEDSNTNSNLDRQPPNCCSLFPASPATFLSGPASRRERARHSGLTLYLFDTNIVSADAPAKQAIGQGTFAAWIRRNGDRLFISTITIAEIEAGIVRSIRIGAITKAKRLRRWLAAVEHFYAGRILAFGIEEARDAGAILDRARAHDPGFDDIAIAAAAVARGLTILTANERHFAPFGVAFANPLKELPSEST